MVNDKFGGMGGVFWIYKNLFYLMVSVLFLFVLRNGKGFVRLVLEWRLVLSVDVMIDVVKVGGVFVMVG